MRLRQLALLVVAAVAASGCATDGQLLTPDGKPLVNAPPAPYRIAVLPVAATEAADDPQARGLRFTITADALRNRLVARMNSLRAATDVFVTATAEEATATGADLILAPRLVGTPRIEHVSVSQYWWASGLLWITTWIGGLLVPDSTYEAHVVLECDFRNAAGDASEVIGLTVASGRADLNFWDRNTFLTGGFFLSLLLPPFWTTDAASITSDSLSERALDQLTGRITSFLKFELAEREKDTYGQVVFDSPANDTIAGASTVVQGTVHGRHAIEAIAITANGAPVALTSPVRARLLQQVVGVRGRYEEPFRSEPILLRPGRNVVAVKITLLDNRNRALVSSRTLTVQGNPAGDAGGR